MLLERDRNIVVDFSVDCTLLSGIDVDCVKKGEIVEFGFKGRVVFDDVGDAGIWDESDNIKDGVLLDDGKD